MKQLLCCLLLLLYLLEWHQRVVDVVLYLADVNVPDVVSSGFPTRYISGQREREAEQTEKINSVSHLKVSRIHRGRGVSSIS